MRRPLGWPVSTRTEEVNLRRIAFAGLATAAAVAIFLVDAFSPLGLAVAVLYGIVVLMSVSFCDQRGVVLVALGCGLLTLAGYLIGHGADEPGAPLLRALVSLAALAVTTALVTKNQGAADRLVDSERRYRSIFESTAVAIWEDDFTGPAAILARLRRNGVDNLDAHLAARPDLVRQCMSAVRGIDANPAAMKLVGAADKAELKTSLPNILLPESEAMFRSLLVALAGRADTFASETQIQTLHGERRSVLVRATFAPPPQRHQRVLVGVVDLTERTRFERALEEARLELAHASRVMTLGELAASIAHEVNQPLAAVVTNGEAGLRWLDRPVPDIAEVRACVEEIVTQGRRAAEVIQSLRAMSRKGEQQRAPVSINGVVTEALALVARELDGRGVSVLLDLEPGLPDVMVDRIQLQQVVVNLLVNAAHAMELVESRELRVESRLDPAGQVHVAVSDCGIGLSDQVMSRLFTAFHTTKPQGMGIGLSICRSIMDAHGGRIWAECNQGPGATFRLELPVAGSAVP
ncbi:sensor histidine kinase [Rhodoplanes roseus]|uniref:sensor histidine kinase n=1 Tax=Rhodoplanes roseus TaxID=29409 RepID=UPI001472DF9C|nr:ATP-binding protein [Rhodoplanes roseus]